MAKDCLPGIVACADLCSGCATVVLREGTESSCQQSHTGAMGMDRRSTARPAAECLEDLKGGYRTALWTTWGVQFEAEHS